ncbi:hypothetical protein MMC06_003133 [Schaereria dolodes]|nr:hypothetical protein [Schaereria dolodes]
MALPRIEATNALALGDFEARYLPDENLRWKNGVSQPGLSRSIKFESSATIPPADLMACFDLLVATSASAYATSSIGWSPASKRKEMRLPDLRYLLVKSVETAQVQGFLSFMLTYEDGHETVYCYEIHLESALQGLGLGRHLIGIMEEIGRSVGVEKAMLTVFLKNEAALRFYEGLEYVEDGYSPRVRKLRNNVVKKPDYIILSKPLN